MERRLTAILMADVVGYSRLMGEDEAATLATLKRHRRELINPKTEQYHGRTIKLIGDGALMEFPSAVDAVMFAVEVQLAIEGLNATIPESRQVRYRIGINIGDVIVDGEDIYGDGVNIAARLESLADPGGVCISRSVHTQIKSKLDLSFEDLGEKQVKNIAEPVQVYRVEFDDKVAALTTPVVRPARRGKILPVAAAVLCALVVLVAGVAWWQLGLPKGTPEPVERQAQPLPDKPSIAILPFNNMSDDPEQEYFADGMTEDLITDLSKVSGMFVIARNSTFAYKGKSPDVRQVGKDLGVRNVLEGSVRRIGNKVRINVQLIDAVTGGHKWAQRYDGTLSEIFDLQDQVTRSIIRELEVLLTPKDKARQAERKTVAPQAHDAFLRGWAHYVRSSAQDYAAAIPYLEQALRIDPDYSRAHAVLASIYQIARLRGWQAHLGLTPDDTLENAIQHLAEARERPTPLAHQVASAFATRRARHEEAVTEAEAAIKLDGNDPAGYFAMARALAFSGQPEQAVTFIDKAKRLDPYHPADYVFYTGVIEFQQEKYQAAAATLEQAHKLAREHPGVVMFLIATYGHLGLADKADTAMRAFRSMADTRSMEWIFSATVPDAKFWRYKRQQDTDRLTSGLRKAGLPEFAAEWTLPRSDRLTGDAVHSLLFGHTIRGHHPVSKIEFSMRWGTEGEFTAEGLWNGSGTSKIDDFRLCNQWAKFKPSCCVIYRNTGISASSEQYLLVQRSGTFPFSVME